MAVGGMTSFVHGGEHVLLAAMHLHAGMAPGDALPVSGKVTFVACSASLCVPQAATVHLDLTVGDGKPDPAERALFAAARRAQPQRIDAAGQIFRTGYDTTLVVPGQAQIAPDKAVFFPANSGVFLKASGERLADGRLVLRGAMADQAALPAEGVIADSTHAYYLHLEHRRVALGAPIASKEAAPESAPASASASTEASGKQPPARARPARHSRTESESADNGWNRSPVVPAVVGAALAALLLGGLAARRR
jgi:hypothetical protein